jgi:hypothetical protein
VSNIYYLSRAGEEIDNEEWKKLQADTKYRVVSAKKASENRTVRLCWVGVAFRHEGTTPAVFIVEVWVINRDGNRVPGKEPKPKWATTLEEARTLFDRTCAQIEKRFRDGDCG